MSQWENRICIYINVYPHTTILFKVWNLNYVTSTILVKHYVQQVSSFTLLASPNSLQSCLAHFTLLRLNFTVNINLWLSSLQRSHSEMTRSCKPAVIIIWWFYTRPGKSRCNILMSQAVWQVTPTCWNHLFSACILLGPVWRHWHNY